MSKYIQVGVTALRDPVTGEALEAVPLYIRTADAETQKKATIDVGPLAKELADMMRTYVQGTKLMMNAECGMRN